MIHGLAISCGSPAVLVPAMSATAEIACSSQLLPPRPLTSPTSTDHTTITASRQHRERLSRPSSGDITKPSNRHLNNSTTEHAQEHRAAARPAQLPYLPVQTSILQQQHTHVATPQQPRQGSRKQPSAARPPAVYGPPVAPLAVPAAVQPTPPPPPPPPPPVSHTHIPYLPAAAGHQQVSSASRGRAVSSSSISSASTILGGWTPSYPPPPPPLPPPNKAVVHRATQYPATALAAAPAGPSSYNLAPAVPPLPAPPPPPRPPPPPPVVTVTPAAAETPQFTLSQRSPPQQHGPPAPVVTGSFAAAATGTQPPPPPPPPVSRQQALTAAQPAAVTTLVPPPPRPPPPDIPAATAVSATLRAASPDGAGHDPNVFKGPLAPWMMWYKQGLLRAVHELVADPQARFTLSDFVKRHGYGDWLLQQLKDRVGELQQQILQKVSAGHYPSSNAAVDGLFELEELVSQAQAAGPPGTPAHLPGRLGYVRTSNSSSSSHTAMHRHDSSVSRYSAASGSNGNGQYHGSSGVSMSPAASRSEQGWVMGPNSSNHNGTQQTAYVDVRSASDAAEARQQLACIVCLEAPRSVLLFPCKHLVLCSKCAAELQDAARSSREWRSVVRAQPVCPVCREAVTSHIEGVYL